jgi:hypothetical protein
MGADPDPGQDNRAGSDHGPLFNDRVQLDEVGVAASRVLVIGEGGIRPYENIILYAQPVPELHPAFDGDSVAYDHIVFNEAVGADVAIAANLCAFENDDELPDASSIADRI